MYRFTSFGRSKHTPHLRIALQFLISSCSFCIAASPLSEVISATAPFNSMNSSSSFFRSFLLHNYVRHKSFFVNTLYYFNEFRHLYKTYSSFNHKLPPHSNANLGNLQIVNCNLLYRWGGSFKVLLHGFNSSQKARTNIGGTNHLHPQTKGKRYHSQNAAWAWPQGVGG